MVGLLTCKNEEDPIKNRGAKVFTTLFINFSDVQGQITLVLVVISGRNMNSFKLLCMTSLPARLRVDQIKNEGARVFTRFLLLKVYGDFSRRSRAANSAVLGPIWPNFELVRDVMDVHVTCLVTFPIKKEALECSQHYTSIFQTRSGR